jgi:hypothetical protein
MQLLIDQGSSKQQEAELRWTQHVQDYVVINVSNKSAGEANKLLGDVCLFCLHTRLS